MSDINPIPDIVRSTGLPSHVWPRARPQLRPALQGCEYALSDDYQQGYKTYYRGLDDSSCRKFKIRKDTVAALEHLPAAQVLGHATLVRTPNGLTAMVSIGEAAAVSMTESYCDLLWAMTKVIENALRCDGEGHQTLSWQHELSHEGYQGQLPWELERSRYLVEPRVVASREPPEGLEYYSSKGHPKRLSQRSVLSRKQGVSELSDESQQMSEALLEVKEEQKKLAGQLEVIQQQNNEILRLLTATMSATPVGKRAADDTSSEKLMHESPRKHYESRTSTLGARKSGGEWFFCSTSRSPESVAFARLLDWLEARLSATTFFKQARGDLRTIPLTADKAPQDAITGCWRTKILSGKILEILTGDVEPSADAAALQRFQSSDCLVLTAAALWSLFDNSLARVPNCQCTFKAASTEFIQCRRKEDEWLVWHTFSNGPVCQGQDCDNNVRIALHPDETGQRLYTTTPCALGWPAICRDSPDSTVWTTLKATANFRKRTETKYTVTNVQAVAQLSVPAAVIPQFGGAVTFSKRYYEIANSIDHDSILAMERAATAIVLVYDERRRLHLTFDGADIIEMCCVQSLKDMGCDAPPPFSHPSALLRLQTWCSSSFVSARNTLITGDHLVRQATERISNLIEITKKAFKADHKFLYWLLEDVLQDSSGRALKAPTCQHTSWHSLASAAPPLILVVGDLHEDCLSVAASTIHWCASTNKAPHILTSIRNWSDKHNMKTSLGGVIASQDVVKRWFLQSHTYARLRLERTENKMSYGASTAEAVFTYKVCETTDSTASPESSKFTNCHCELIVDGKRCLHYVE